MEQKPGDAKAPGARQTRLKTALKANLARRKAQARARSADADDAQKSPEPGADSGGEAGRKD